MSGLVASCGRFFVLTFVVVKVRKRDGDHQILAGKQAMKTVFSEIVCPLAADRFKFGGPAWLFLTGLDKDAHHGFAIFIDDASANDGGRQHPKREVTDLLAFPDRE